MIVELSKEELTYRNASNHMHEATHDYIDEKGMTQFVIESMRATIHNYLMLADEHGVSRKTLLGEDDPQF